MVVAAYVVALVVAGGDALLRGAAPGLGFRGRRSRLRAVVETAPSPVSTRRRSLHEAVDVAQEGEVDVGDGHRLYYQVRNGNASLPLALFLHGGPGAGCAPNHARFFDPKKWRVCLVDQRGCGRSTYPGASPLVDNDTPRLVGDLEALRAAVAPGGEPWGCVLGGSWGSTLALAYAQRFPDALRALALRGVCLMRKKEVDWLFAPEGGAAQLAPKGYAAFAAHVIEDAANAPPPPGRAVLDAYYARFTSEDSTLRDNAARSWMTWEMKASSVSRRGGVATFESGNWSFAAPTLNETDDYFAHVDDKKNATAPKGPNATAGSGAPNATDDAQRRKKYVPAQPMLTCHYSVHDGFLAEAAVLGNIDKIRHIPAIAVQGTADIICPPVTAYELHAAWPELELRLVSGAGHSHYDPDIQTELLEATDKLHALLEAEP